MHGHADALRTALTLLSESVPPMPVDVASLVWDRPMFVLRSASLERMQALLGVVGARWPAPPLHVMSHTQDEAALRSMIDGAFTFYPFSAGGRYRLEAIPGETLERLRAAGFGTLIFLDGGTALEGLHEVERLTAAIHEPGVVCYRGDGTFARPAADWRLHAHAAAAAARLVERYRVQTVPCGAVLVRPRPVVVRGTEGRPPAGQRPQYFLVTSQGLTATAWLAASLNLHPDISCSGVVEHAPVSMTCGYDHDLGDGPVRNNPLRPLQHMYDELECFAPECTYYGNTHAYSAQEALDCLLACPTRRDVTLVNVIRHPVPRTEGAVANLVRIYPRAAESDWLAGIREGIDACVDTRADSRHDIEKQFDVDFRDLRNRVVLYSYYHAAHNDAWAAELTEVAEACHVPIERLMIDRDYFAWLVWELTGREVVASRAFLDRIHAEDHLQSGRISGRGRPPGGRAQYDAWSAWERLEFRQAASRLDLSSVYAPFGYDFSFVR